MATVDERRKDRRYIWRSPYDQQDLETRPIIVRGAGPQPLPVGNFSRDALLVLGPPGDGPIRVESGGRIRTFEIAEQRPCPYGTVLCIDTKTDDLAAPLAHWVERGFLRPVLPVTLSECVSCHHLIPAFEVLCPGCLHPNSYPNVREASHLRHLVNWQRKYLDAIAACKHAPNLSTIDAVLSNLQAIIARPVSAVLAAATDGFLKTYHIAVENSLREPDPNLHYDRTFLDGGIFPDYKKHVHFAVLSLGTRGLAHYGDCHVTLDTRQIEQRASLFSSNSLEVAKSLILAGTTPDNFREGLREHRAPWHFRSRLAVAKFGCRLCDTTPGDVVSHPTHFIEVNIYGPLQLQVFGHISFESAVSEAIRREVATALAPFTWITVQQ